MFHVYLSLHITFLLARAALSDVLQDAAGNAFCRSQPDGIICDSVGIKVCNQTSCVSICRTLGLEQCRCADDVPGTRACRLCCGSYRQTCLAITEFRPFSSSDAPRLVWNRQPEFCYNPCNTAVINGKLCNLTATATGVCFRGQCADPCSTVDAGWELCKVDYGISSSCSVGGSDWCCHRKSSSSCELQHGLLQNLNAFTGKLINMDNNAALSQWESFAINLHFTGTILLVASVVFSD